MTADHRIAILADIHGEHRTLTGILDHCRRNEVDRVVLLGDLFDRVEQIEACVRELRRWPVTGVLGNHERDALRHAVERTEDIAHLFTGSGDSVEMYEALFLHDQLDRDLANGSRLVFAGHTHVRQAFDDRGPLDLALGHITLHEHRRYLINPGAVVDGQFAIWDRKRSRVLFERV